MSAMTHQNLVQFLTTLTLILMYQSHHYHLAINPLNLPEMVKEDTAVHQKHYLVQSANTHNNLNIQPSQKIWKMESDGSLAPPAY